MIDQRDAHPLGMQKDLSRKVMGSNPGAGIFLSLTVDHLEVNFLH